MPRSRSHITSYLLQVHSQLQSQWARCRPGNTQNGGTVLPIVKSNGRFWIGKPGFLFEFSSNQTSILLSYEDICMWQTDGRMNRQTTWTITIANSNKSQSNMAKPASNSPSLNVGDQDPHVTQCSLGPTGSPPLIGPRSVQPFYRGSHITDTPCYQHTHSSQCSTSTPTLFYLPTRKKEHERKVSYCCCDSNLNESQNLRVFQTLRHSVGTVDNLFYLHSFTFFNP